MPYSFGKPEDTINGEIKLPNPPETPLAKTSMLVTKTLLEYIQKSTFEESNHNEENLAGQLNTYTLVIATIAFPKSTNKKP